MLKTSSVSADRRQRDSTLIVDTLDSPCLAYTTHTSSYYHRDQLHIVTKFDFHYQITVMSSLMRCSPAPSLPSSFPYCLLETGLTATSIASRVRRVRPGRDDRRELQDANDGREDKGNIDDTDKNDEANVPLTPETVA